MKLHNTQFEGDIFIPENYHHLQFLVLNSNPNIKNIYFQGSNPISTLEIAQNGITSINSSFQNLRALKRIEISGNQLTDIDLSYFSSLKTIDLSTNPISTDKIDSLRLKYPNIDIVCYDYDEKVKQ